MKKEEIDHRKLPFNPHRVEFQPWLTKNIPAIEQRDFGKMTRVQGLRYIMLMYDHRSPVHEIPDLDWFGKKFEAAEAAGFELKKDKNGYLRFDEEVIDALVGKNKAFNDAIIDYLGWLNSTIWTELVYLQETVMRYVKEALGGSRGDKTTIKAVQDIYERMDVLVRKMTLGATDNEDIVRRIYHRVEESRLLIKPEDYARRLAEGDTLSEDNPYGANYVINKIRFVGEYEPTKGEV